jgi:YidC/Oxa1 family membrane protein insertase
MRKTTRIQLLLITLFLIVGSSACSSDAVSMYDLPIGWEGGWLPVQWLVTQVAELLYLISKFFGGYYWVGLIVTTLLVRTIGWPIYAKSNQTTSNMQMAQPELTKLQEKYKGRTDEASQRKMQAEQMEIYKRYGINPLGCLLPFAQMPIFIAMYQVVRRVPKSIVIAEGLKNYSDLKFNFLWIDNLGEADPYYILPILVGVLMFLYQRYSMKKPEYLNNKKYDKTGPASQSESTMKMMSYFMVIMLVYIAIGNAGIALYWIIGNGYQFVQTYFNRKSSYKKYILNQENNK